MIRVLPVKKILVTSFFILFSSCAGVISGLDLTETEDSGNSALLALLGIHTLSSANAASGPTDPPTFTASPASGSVMADLETISLSFSRNVVNLDSSAVVLSGSGAGSLTPSVSGSAKEYTITLSGGAADGDLTITLDGVEDEYQNALQSNTIVYTLDTLNPTQTASPESGSYVNSLTSIQINYSKSVSGSTTLSNYILSGAGKGSLAIDSVTENGSNSVTLHLSGEVADGDILLTINGIQDSRGRDLNGQTVSYVGDVTDPVMSATPTNGSNVSNLSSIDVSFSEQVTGADDPSDYAFSGTGLGSLAIDSVTQLSDTQYRLDLSGSAVEGSLTTTVSGVTDRAGNPLSGTTITYSIYQSSPTVSTSPAEGSKVSSLSPLTLTYSRPVSGSTTTGNYALSGSGVGTLAIDSITDPGNNQVRLNLTGSPANGSVTLTISNVEDLAGNALTGNTKSYALDVTAPTKTTTPTDGTVLNTLPTVDVTYSETVLGGANPANYTLSGAGKGSLTITGASNLTGNTYRLTLSGTPTNGAITLSISGVTDEAGNALSGTSVGFTADTERPTWSTSPAAGTTINELSTIDVTFSEAVNGAATLSNYTLSGAGQGGLTIDSVSHLSGNTYRLFLSGIPAIGSLTLSISGITDSVGNTPSNSSVNYTARRYCRFDNGDSFNNGCVFK